MRGKPVHLLPGIAPLAILSACSTVNVAPDADFLQQTIESVRAQYQVPAIAVATMSADRLLLEKVSGVRALSNTSAASLVDYFHIGSCSKSVLALIATRLTEDGKIQWNTQFFDVFPELLKDANAGYHAITLEDLFLGKAGIAQYVDIQKDPIPPLEGPLQAQRLDFIRHVLRREPASQHKNGKYPHLYSNAGYTMASAMLEKTTGIGYEALVSDVGNQLDIVFKVGWPNTIAENQPSGHTISNGAVEEYPPDHAYRIPNVLTPAGDLSVSAHDYARYTQLHLRGLTGQDTYVSNPGWTNMHFAQSPTSLGTANSKLGGKRVTGFDGSAGTFYCRSLLFPDDDYALSILMNAGSGSAEMQAMEALTKKILRKQFNWSRKFWIWW